MAKKFTKLRLAMSAESQTRSEHLANVMLAEMPLHELRQARGLSQQVLASLLKVQQPAIAKLERRTDMYLSTLRSLQLRRCHTAGFLYQLKRHRDTATDGFDPGYFWGFHFTPSFTHNMHPSVCCVKKFVR